MIMKMSDDDDDDECLGWRCFSFRMTEYADKTDEERASAFIVSTCQLLPKSFLLISDHMHDLIGSSSTAPKKYALLCGSAVELYIRPVNTCIDDLDFLVVQTDRLAFSGDFPVLPSDMSGLADNIKCCKIQTYHRYPGFVRLRVWGELNYNWKYKKYEFNQTAFTNRYVMLNLDNLASEYSLLARVRRPVPNIVSGPAIKLENDIDPACYLGSDVVESLGCPQWPREAEGWVKRPRNNGWPTSDTITKVVQNGCHIVYVQHRSCRHDIKQWRFSFSLAEVILLQSWTQIQQIVYHLLRFFAKRELIQKDCPKEDEILCPYHLKTLMLWTCEEMPPGWWNSSSVITICCELLKNLSEWLRRRYCPNYFIPEANLFHEQWSSTILDRTERRLNEFYDPGILCHWFVENYIGVLLLRHVQSKNPMNVVPHFVDYILKLTMENIHSVDSMMAVFEFWKVSELISLDHLYFYTFAQSHKNSRFVITNGFSSGLRLSLKVGYILRCLDTKSNRSLRDLPTIQNVLCFTDYDILLCILHTAYGLHCGEIAWDSSLFVEFVNAISLQPRNVRSQYHNFPKAYTAHSSHFQFLRAQDLMENLTGSNSCSEFQLVSLLSKHFLNKTLEHDGYKSNDIASAVLTYLAALHFAKSEYQQAIRLCLAIFVDQPYKKVKESLNACCLLFINDIVRIVGVCVLHKKITKNNLHFINRRLYLDLRLSPYVFAHYLTVLSAERICKHVDLYHDLPDSAFPMDEYLKAILKRKRIISMKSGTHVNAVRQIVYLRLDSLTETYPTAVNPLTVKETVIHVLMEYALENMTSFYSGLCKDLAIQCNTAECYRALYLYKCRQYDQVLDLCERILKESDLQSTLKKFSFANVLLLPPLDSFFDSDVQSLLGFHTLFYYSSSLNNDMGKVEFSDESTFERWFARYVYSYQWELVYSLRQHYSIRCHYFLGRHFLARYLKVRCCIDCNFPHSEALTEFADQKTNLPFEHIIRRFLLRKLRI